MKKRYLLSLSIIAMLSIALTAGTFAWFASSVTSSDNTFTAGTLTLNNKETETLTGNLGKIANLIPGVEKELTPWSVQNTGSIDSKLKFTASGTTNDVEKDGYLVDLSIKIGEIELNDSKGTFMNITDFEKLLNTTLMNTILNSNQTLVISGKVKLNDVDNTYQGKTLTLGIRIDAIQSDQEWK